MKYTSEVCPPQKFCIFDLSILDSLQFQHYFQTNRHLQVEEEKPFNSVGANMGPVEWGRGAMLTCHVYSVKKWSITERKNQSQGNKGIQDKQT